MRCYDSAVLFEFADWLKDHDPATAPKNTEGKVAKRGGRGRTKQAAPPAIKPLAKPVSRKRKGRQAAEDEEDMEVEETVSRATEKTTRRPSKRTAESQSAAQEAAAQEVPEDGRGEEERVAAGQRHAGHVEEGHSREVSRTIALGGMPFPRTCRDVARLFEATKVFYLVLACTSTKRALALSCPPAGRPHVDEPGPAGRGG